MNTLTIHDESAAGDILHKIALQFEQEYITAEELIKARIEKEVEKYESNVDNYTYGLVLPTEAEKRLNRKKGVKIDLEKQFQVALEAFQNNGFLILVDNEQVDDLEQKFLVEESTHVSFIKLTPLVGG